MKNLELTDWAAVAEVIGTVGVIVSLVFVVFSIDNNTEEVRASQTNYIYDVSREIELAVAADQEWTRIVVQGRNRNEQLSEIEQFRYDAYLVANIDLWDGMLERHADGLMRPGMLESWEAYFVVWVIRHITESDWQRLQWQYDGDIGPKVEAAISAEPIE